MGIIRWIIRQFHPERYDLVKKMAKSVGVSLDDLIRNEKAIAQIDFQNFTSTEIGLPTLNDLKEELKKPARDPRKGIKLF